MPTKIEILDSDDLVERYVAGESIRSIARRIEVSNHVVARHLDSLGVTRRRPARIVLSDEIIRRYVDGETVQALANEMGIARERLKYHLGELGLLRGIIGRTISQDIVDSYVAGESYGSISDRSGFSITMLMYRFRKLGVLRGPVETEISAGIIDRYIAGEDCTNLARAVGIPNSTLRRRLRMLGLMRPFSDRETMFASFLDERGVAYERQAQFGRYKLDFAFRELSVAVEIDGEWGNRVRSNRRHLYLKRCEEILSRGWHLIEVRCQKFLTAGSADYVVSFLKEARGDPSMIGQHRVVGGDGEPLPATGR